MLSESLKLHTGHALAGNLYEQWKSLIVTKAAFEVKRETIGEVSVPKLTPGDKGDSPSTV